MIRSATFTLKFANKGKVDLYWKIIRDYKELLQLYIDLIYDKILPLKLNLSTKLLPVLNDIKHSAWRQLCYREASQIIRGVEEQAKGKPYTKPTVKNHCPNLDYHLWDIELDKTEGFDAYINIRTPYMESPHKAVTIKIPIKFHRVYNKFINDGWTLNTQSMMLCDNFSRKLFLEREDIEKKQNDLSVGVDCGYKKLLACSDGQIYGRELENIYEKIARKKQGSKAFKRALRERNYATNKAVKDFVANHADYGMVACENLKGLHQGKKFSKKFRNKFQRWSYTKTLNRLEQLSETEGFRLVKVNPAYTSQTCHRCKCVIKSNRQGERYHCSVCGEEIDADINAAINILQLGVYSPQCLEKTTEFL